MEVRPGYKMTEVGVIPNDWSEASLSSLTETGFRITYGVVKPGNNDVNGVSFIRGGDISAGKINESQLRRIPKEVSDQYKRTQLSGGEILISLVGYPGEAAIVPQRLGGANIARQVALFRLNKRLPVNPSFVCIFLQSDIGRRQIFKEAIGSAQQVINLRDIQNIAVALPPTELEQRAIAAALSDADALLDGLDRLIAKKRDLKQAAMQELLTGKTRLPGFSGEWEVNRLEDLGPFLKGSGVKKDEARSGNLPCIRYGEIYTHHDDYVRVFNSWISREVADTATRLRCGDVLFAGSGETKEDIGKCVALVDDVEAFAGGDIIILRPNGGNSLFLGYLLNTPAIASQKTTLGQGDAIVHIRADALACINLSLPGQHEQTAIAEVLSDMDTEIAALEALREKTRDLKRAMMQELLTGRTRLI